jgi:hypothetical protein
MRRSIRKAAAALRVKIAKWGAALVIAAVCGIGLWMRREDSKLLGDGAALARGQDEDS